MNKPCRKGILFVIMMILILFSTLSAHAAETNEQGITLYALNVGKADCLFVSAAGQWYMVDAGYEYSYPLIRTFIDTMNIRRLEAVFLTHCDKDHFGGLASLAGSDVEIGKWYASSCFYDTGKDGHPMIAAAAIRGEEVTWLNAGNVIENGNVVINILGPLETNYNNENNNSLVMTFQHGTDRILLCGDMKVEEEAQLIMRNVIPPCQVIKIGHHGDNNATTEALINCVRPQAAVISTSSVEEPDTPANSVLRTLIRQGVNTYLTQDYEMAVCAAVLSGEVSVTGYKPEGMQQLPEGLMMTLDAENDLLTIWNTGSGQVELKNCFLCATNNGRYYEMPYILLRPQQKCTFGSKKTPDDLHADCVISKKRIWNASKADCAVLMDQYGRRIGIVSNGIIP